MAVMRRVPRTIAVRRPARALRARDPPRLARREEAACEVTVSP
jgi:hypothetical protein